MYYNGLVDTRRIRYGVLPGAFNPPTEAHLALGRAALGVVDQVIFVLPRTMPHKDFSGVPFEIRLRLLKESIAYEPRFAVAQTSGGLFVDIARELRPALDGCPDIYLLCGRDAAERIATWKYEHPLTFDGILEEFGLLVAPRDGDYRIPEKHAARIKHLPLDPIYQLMSATDVRSLIHKGRAWEHLVPAPIRESVRLLYGALPSSW